MKMMVGSLRLLLLFLWVLFGIVAGLFSPLMSVRIHQLLIKYWHRAVLLFVGIKPSFSGARPEKGALMVSNHVSWLDISVLGSRYPVVFLANNEISSWPVLGYLIRKAGTLFIHRGKGSVHAISSINSTLARQQSVAIFPEGKTTDGKDVARFQPRLFQAAIDADTTVQPLVIRYQNCRNEIQIEVSYAGDINFVQSLWRVVCLPYKSVSAHLFEPLAGFQSRDDLSKCAEEKIRERLQIY
jgi:1-acyl-sn-glycerol-3-phosphate acyltransferase